MLVSFGTGRSALPILVSLTWATVWTVRCQESPPPVAAAQTLHSTVLNEDRRILVRLPRNYQLDSTTRYPVLYKFDGDNQLERYIDSIDILNSIDAMPDMIVVAIPNARGQRNRDLTPSTLRQEEGAPEMGRGDRFLDFIERELIPSIDKLYRTTSERVLAGHSRGALLVLQSLLTKPDLFHARFLFSAPLMRDEQRLILAARSFLREHRNHQSFLYCNWGENENEGMNQSYFAMKALLTTDAPKGLRWTLERARAADHQQTPLIALPAALYQYFSGPRANASSTPNNRTMPINSRSPARKPK